MMAIYAPLLPAIQSLVANISQWYAQMVYLVQQIHAIPLQDSVRTVTTAMITACVHLIVAIQRMEDRVPTPILAAMITMSVRQIHVILNQDAHIPLLLVHPSTYAP